MTSLCPSWRGAIGAIHSLAIVAKPQTEAEQETEAAVESAVDDLSRAILSLSAAANDDDDWNG